MKSAKSLIVLVLAISALAAPSRAGLLGLDLVHPFTVYDSTGITSYDASSDVFSVQASLLATRYDGVDILIPIGSATIEFRLKVNASGQLVGGVTGHDLTMTGVIDLDDDGKAEYSGTLLTGEIRSFGFQESGATDEFDATFAVTGGSMAGLYGKRIGVTITVENSTFNDSFGNSFGGGAKGTIGNLEGSNCPRTPGYWKNHVSNWALHTLTVGGVAYNQSQLLNLLNNRLPNGTRSNNAAARLAKFVVATKLSYLNGAVLGGETISEALALADAFLAAHAPGSNLTPAEAAFADDLKDLLDAYLNSNPAGCCG